MNIKDLSEDVGRYERYLLALQSKAKEVPPPAAGRQLGLSPHFITHLRLVSRKVNEIVGQVNEAKRVAQRRGDQKKVGDIDKLVTRASEMFKRYEDLKQEVESTLQKRTGT